MSKCSNFESKKITIIGGGAAGMVAAIFAAKNIGGYNIRIIEKNDKIGRKLLATGNGRCNMTNRFCHETFKNISKFMDQFNFQETINFFKKIGVITREESDGRIYPYSEQAVSVQQALKSELESLNVEIIYNAYVKKVETISNGFNIVTEINDKCKNSKRKDNIESFFSEKIIIATGGKAGPQYGSTGEGFNIARNFGHTIIKPIPSLTQITSSQLFFKELKGVRAKGSVSLLKNLELLDMEIGEIQFTDSGLSGICIFNLSRLIRLEDSSYNDYIVKIDLMPEFTQQQVFDLLVERAVYLGDRKVKEFLNGLINEKLACVILKESGLDENIINCYEIYQLNKKQLKKIVTYLKNWNIPVSGTKGFKEAQVTSGGIDLQQLDKYTLESKLIKDVYFAGEVVNVDGKCGGYNLQWAWTSGYITGNGASKNIE
ncbi:BaiN/RdsA family NAD(P)/FAD-dependent oxidoreductase [Anaerovorax odorimutans]|uniref:NAD(P)/FAD-dependent oxidoreductase n=1 Tax=Anaerovorax odorimutans TaxID=109327 RepID=UPI0004136B38|nr:NAD(P)/FAD-dependent oxidoreductase [Anaerovorax odorimutans]